MLRFLRHVCTCKVKGTGKTGVAPKAQGGFTAGSSPGSPQPWPRPPWTWRPREMLPGEHRDLRHALETQLPGFPGRVGWIPDSVQPREQESAKGPGAVPSRLFAPDDDLSVRFHTRADKPRARGSPGQTLMRKGCRPSQGGRGIRDPAPPHQPLRSRSPAAARDCPGGWCCLCALETLPCPAGPWW